MKVSIVIPTYNERENIAKLIPDIFDVFKVNNFRGNVIVVDDNSPDNTADEVRKLKGEYPINLIEREGKQGIGSAYIAGFGKALNLESDIVFEMDADFSHDPRYIPDFVKNIDNFDLVLGSRYIDGGSIENWDLGRKAISRSANFIARIFLGLKVNDITTGYRAYRREVLEGIDLNKIKSEGYAFQAEILFKAKEKRFRMGEIPIVFVDRKKGSSKLSKREILNFFMLCIKIWVDRLF